MDDTTVMIKVDFQDMQIIGMMHSVIVKNRAKCGVQEIRCQRLIVDIGQKFVYTKLIVLKEVLRESSFGELIGGKCGLVSAVNVRRASEIYRLQIHRQTIRSDASLLHIRSL